METSFKSLAHRIDPSWWPTEIRQALMRGAVSEFAQDWCLQWWHNLLSVLQSGPKPKTSLEFWARSDSKLFFHIAESVGLCVFREEIRRIIDKKRLEELRLILGAHRLNLLVSEFPSIKLLEPPALPAKLSPQFLKICGVIGLQLGQICAKQSHSQAESVFKVSLPLNSDQDGAWRSDDRFESVRYVIDFLVKHEGASV